MDKHFPAGRDQEKASFNVWFLTIHLYESFSSFLNSITGYDVVNVPK